MFLTNVFKIQHFLCVVFFNPRLRICPLIFRERGKEKGRERDRDRDRDRDRHQVRENID